MAPEPGKTTLEDVRVEIATLTGEVRASNEILRAHLAEDAKIHAGIEHRLNDHSSRLRQQEVDLQSHRAGHKQLRIVGGVFLSLGAIAAALSDRLAAFFHWLK